MNNFRYYRFLDVNVINSGNIIIAYYGRQGAHHYENLGENDSEGIVLKLQDVKNGVFLGKTNGSHQSTGSVLLPF